MTELNPEKLTAKGYRRTSNRYGILSRIDRDDWKRVLEKHLGKVLPEDCEFNIDGNWPDYYRRVLSQDTMSIDPVIAKLVPNSRHDMVGYVELDPKKG